MIQGLYVPTPRNIVNHGKILIRHTHCQQPPGDGSLPDALGKVTNLVVGRCPGRIVKHPLKCDVEPLAVPPGPALVVSSGVMEGAGACSNLTP